MKLDQTFLDHLRRDHVPFRRDCKACLAGSFRGHAHRRIVSPEAWCLSLDVIGPTRQGTDEYVKKVRYALIGTLVVPDMLGKLLQPADGDSDDRGEGVGPIDYEDPLLEDGAIQDEEEVASAAEEARNEREMAKWKARVEKDKLEGVSCVEVPFVVTMATKSSAEVLAATKDILVQVKRLGLVVQRIHSDRGREFICKGFRALCRDRGIVWTTTTGDQWQGRSPGWEGQECSPDLPVSVGYVQRHVGFRHAPLCVQDPARRGYPTWWSVSPFASVWDQGVCEAALVEAQEGGVHREGCGRLCAVSLHGCCKGLPGEDD